MPRTPRSDVVYRGKWSVVRKRKDGGFTVWKWNVWLMKWVSAGSPVIGFGTLEEAKEDAAIIDKEYDQMFAANRNPPPP